jgi:hypothetical protein
MAENIEDVLREECALLDELINDEILSIKISQICKHPEIQIVINEDEEENDFIRLAFDPWNNEFYVKKQPDSGPELRIMLKDSDEIISLIHELAHDLYDEESEDNEENEAYKGY